MRSCFERDEPTPKDVKTYDEIILNQINKIVTLDRLNKPWEVSKGNPLDLDIKILKALLKPFDTRDSLNDEMLNILEKKHTKEVRHREMHMNLPTTTDKIEGDTIEEKARFLNHNKGIQREWINFDKINQEYFMALITFAKEQNILKRDEDE